MNAFIRSTNNRNKKVFVSNIPYDFTKFNELEELFENEGTNNMYIRLTFYKEINSSLIYLFVHNIQYIYIYFVFSW